MGRKRSPEPSPSDCRIAVLGPVSVGLPLAVESGKQFDMQEVLDAAGSKWNFLPFRAGLVGRKCIGVDPRDLIHESQRIGCHPETVSTGRRIDDGMALNLADLIYDAKFLLDRRQPGGRL